MKSEFLSLYDEDLDLFMGECDDFFWSF